MLKNCYPKVGFEDEYLWKTFFIKRERNYRKHFS